MTSLREQLLICMTLNFRLTTYLLHIRSRAHPTPLNSPTRTVRVFLHPLNKFRSCTASAKLLCCSNPATTIHLRLSPGWQSSQLIPLWKLPHNPKQTTRLYTFIQTHPPAYDRKYWARAPQQGFINCTHIDLWTPSARHFLFALRFVRHASVLSPWASYTVTLPPSH